MAIGSSSPSDLDRCGQRYGHPDHVVELGGYVFMLYENDLEGGVDITIYRKEDDQLKLLETISITEEE